MCWCKCGCQGPACGNYRFFPTVWVPRTRFRSKGSVANTLSPEPSCWLSGVSFCPWLRQSNISLESLKTIAEHWVIKTSVAIRDHLIRHFPYLSRSFHSSVPYNFHVCSSGPLTHPHVLCGFRRRKSRSLGKSLKCSVPQFPYHHRATVLMLSPQSSDHYDIIYSMLPGPAPLRHLFLLKTCRRLASVPSHPPKHGWKTSLLLPQAIICLAKHHKFCYCDREIEDGYVVEVISSALSFLFMKSFPSLPCNLISTLSNYLPMAHSVWE